MKRPGEPHEIAGLIGYLISDQASYLGVPVEGPYKSDHYRY